MSHSVKRARSVLVPSGSVNLGPVGGYDDLADGIKCLEGDSREIIAEQGRLRRDADALFGLSAECVVRHEGTERACDNLESRLDRVERSVQQMHRVLEDMRRQLELLLRRVPEDPEPTLIPESPRGPLDGRVLQGSCDVPICGECGEFCTECVCFDEVDQGQCDGCGGAFDVCRCGGPSDSQCAEMVAE